MSWLSVPTALLVYSLGDHYSASVGRWNYIPTLAGREIGHESKVEVAVKSGRVVGIDVLKAILGQAEMEKKIVQGVFDSQSLQGRAGSECRGAGCSRMWHLARLMPRR